MYNYTFTIYKRLCTLIIYLDLWIQKHIQMLYNSFLSPPPIIYNEEKHKSTRTTAARGP